VSPRNKIATELYNAMMVTFGPPAGIPFPVSAESKDCKADRGCLLSSDGGDGNTYFGVRPLVIYFQTPTGTPQPVISTPKGVYNFFAKSEPYSNLNQILKLDATGPIAGPKMLAAADAGAQPCQQSVGLKFGDLVKNCVKVTGDMTADTINYNKLIGGRQHDLENWTFNVVGVNQNFTKTQGPFEVVQDGDKPSDNDIATDWTFDVRAKGHPNNDYGASGYEARGIAMVFIEWARLMLADVAAIQGLAVPKKLGDPTCLPAPADLTPGNQLIPGHTLPAGCTGLEGILIPYAGGTDFAPDLLNPASNWDTNGDYDPATSLSPGDPKMFVCVDPATQKDCDGPGTGSMFDTLVSHVTRVMGGGNINKVPAELRDRRYYFRHFGVALVKYLKAYGAFDPAKRDFYPSDTQNGPGMGPTVVKNQAVDLESLFFDNSFGNLFDKIEYIERDFMTTTAPNNVPWDFEYGTDVKFGNQRYDNWYRRMDREEVALYTAMTVAGAGQTTKTDPPGKQNTVNLTNLFGSPVLSGAYASYAAATAVGTPMDLNGTKPRFSYYPGVWGRTPFSVGHSAMKVNDADKMPNLGAAKVIIPNYLDPHNAVVPATPVAAVAAVAGDGGALSCANGTTPQGLNGGTANQCCPPKNALLMGNVCCGSGLSIVGGQCDMPQATGGALTALVPWVELQPGIGFTVPINGTRDREITTAQLDFTGVLETYLVDFEPWIDQIKPSCTYDNVCGTGYTCNKHGQCVDGTIKVDAIEASDFLGEVFLCQDGPSGDLLSARMYSSALGIVDWLAAHPCAQAACDIIIRYSPFNNYIDFITSRANGVKLSVNAGQGLGRIVDAVLFDPAFAQIQ
jgi:hypothetical protein